MKKKHETKSPKTKKIPETSNPLDITPEELVFLKKIVALGQENLLKLLQALHAERTLEFTIYSSREQIFYVAWAACVAGAFAGIAQNNPAMAIGIPIATGIFATLIGHLRKAGLKASYDALNMRHKWVVAITECVPQTEVLLLPLGFRSRLLKTPNGDSQIKVLDDIHIEGFQFTGRVIRWTPAIFLVLTMIGAVCSLLSNDRIRKSITLALGINL